MKKRSSDALVGALVLGASGLLIGAVSGSRGVALASLLTVFGSVVMRLFESKSKWSKALAIFMLPALLLTYLKPKKKPSSERDRP